MSAPPYQPSVLLRGAWVALLGLFGAGTGLTVAWYGGLFWVLATLTPAERAPDNRPPDLLRLIQLWLWPEPLLLLVLLGTAVGASLAVHRAGLGDRSRQRWHRRARRLGGGTVGALVGLPIAVVLVGVWSVLTSRLDGHDPGPSPPDLTTQVQDVLVFGLLAAIPLAFSLVGSRLSTIRDVSGWWSGGTASSPTARTRPG